jgi:hypothetical protein
VFFDDLEVSDEIARTCEGNRRCILDLAVTGDMELAIGTLNDEKQTNLTESIISKHFAGNNYS